MDTPVAESYRKIGELERYLSELQEMRKLAETPLELPAFIFRMLLQHLERDGPPKLPVPASRQDCIATAQLLESTYEAGKKKFAEEMRIGRSVLERVVQRDDMLHDHHIFKMSESSLVQSSLLDLKRQLQREVDEYAKLEYRQRYYDTELELACLSALQIHLMKMMQDQEDELKQWFFREHREWGRHLTISESSRHTVKLEGKTRQRQDRFPFEIKSLIYSHVDLETSVDLRLVSSSWYAAFRENEAVWENQMRLRNPWMKPGDPDLATWADCVLVFVARLKSWPTEDNLENMKPDTVPAPCKAMVAVALKQPERLSNNFTPMVEHPHRWCTSQMCDKYHCVTAPLVTHAIVDLRTRHMYEDACDRAQVVHFDEKYVTVRYRDRDMVLPQDFEVDTVREEGGCIRVLSTRNEIALLNSHNPHIDSGIYLDNRHEIIYKTSDLHGGVMLVKVTDSSARERSYSFKIANLHTQKLDDYGQVQFSTPAANFNGLIWWNIAKKTIMPTFIDLNNPGQVYYCPKKAVALPSDTYCFKFSQGAHHRNLSQFVTTASRDDFRKGVLIDLARGAVTIVHHPDVEVQHLGRMVPGFVNGSFYPCHVSVNTTRTWDIIAEELEDDEMAENVFV